jgi:hypothetical protein
MVVFNRPEWLIWARIRWRGPLGDFADLSGKNASVPLSF